MVPLGPGRRQQPGRGPRPTSPLRCHRPRGGGGDDPHRGAPAGHRDPRGAHPVNTLELCRVLLAGSVPAAEVPELTDEETRAEVRRRLADAGCELSYAPGADRWLAILAGPVPSLEEHARVVDLGPAELTVIAACWLHLRFLQAERAPRAGADGSSRGDTLWLDPDDLGIMLGGRLGGRDLGDVLVLLCQAGYLSLREGQLFAGPLLET